MGIFRNKIEELTSKITEENLLLLNVKERKSEYYLKNSKAYFFKSITMKKGLSIN